MKYDLQTAKLLVESRKFDLIEIEHPLPGSLSRIDISAKKLKLDEISFMDFLELRSIQANSLLCKCSNEEFKDDFSDMDIRWLFKYYLILTITFQLQF